MIKKLKDKIGKRKIAYFEYSEWEEHYNPIGLLKLAHSLEKGMGLPSVKQGYGIDKAKKLLNGLEDYYKAHKDCTSFTYLEALKILSEYVSYQKKEGIPLGDIVERTNDLVMGISGKVADNYSLISAGYDVVKKTDCINQFDFYEYIRNRHSIRDYDIQQSVSEEEIQQAIRIASLAPSACNRQPSKVYYSLNREQSKLVGNIIPGNRGYEDAVPYYAVITVDRSVFDPTEMYQWFVNGGIFTAYFVEGLYSQNIGSCIFQFPFNDPKRSSQMRQLINAEENEAICAVVSFGKYKESFKCLCAQRKSIAEISAKF